MFRFIPIIFLLLLASCYRATEKIEISLTTPTCEREISCEKSLFPSLSESEKQEEFAKEMKVASSFAKEQDYYRAITFFKRALFLLQESEHDRRIEINYYIALCYYLGQKYSEVIETVYQSDLASVDEHFCAYRDLLIILAHSFHELKDETQAFYLQEKLKALYPEEGDKLSFFFRLEEGDLSALNEERFSQSYMENIVSSYQARKKSVRAAEMYNALLPGLGYLYVGQYATAFTAAMVNGLFIAATVIAFERNNAPLGIILASLEGGWYFGGISGGGIAAKRYNESLYCCFAERIASREKLYPAFRLQFSF